MSVEQNKQAFRTFIEEALNKGDQAAVDKYLAPNLVDYSPLPGQGPGLEGVKQAFGMLRSAFPDFHATLEFLVAEGELVAARGSWTGTHKGDFMGTPATGKKVTVTFSDFVRFADGKMVEHWGNQDDLGMMQQLGLVPAMQEPAKV